MKDPRTRVRLILAAVAVGVAAVGAVGLVAAAAESAEPPAPSLASMLDCGGARYISTQVDHEAGAKETRTPAQVIADITDAEKGSFPAVRAAVTSQRAVYSSPTRQDYALTDARGVIAVYRFVDEGDGPVLVSAAHCNL